MCGTLYQDKVLTPDKTHTALSSQKPFMFDDAKYDDDFVCADVHIDRENFVESFDNIDLRYIMAALFQSLCFLSSGASGTSVYGLLMQTKYGLSIAKVEVDEKTTFDDLLHSIMDAKYENESSIETNLYSVLILFSGKFSTDFQFQINKSTAQIIVTVETEEYSLCKGKFWYRKNLLYVDKFLARYKYLVSKVQNNLPVKVSQLPLAPDNELDLVKMYGSSSSTSYTTVAILLP